METEHIDREIYGLLRLDDYAGILADGYGQYLLNDPDLDVGIGPWCRSCGMELLGAEVDFDFCDDCSNGYLGGWCGPTSVAQF